MRAAKVQASLRIRAVSPEPSLLAHTSSESRGTFRQKARSLVPLNGWACAIKICHDGMLEDTNSLDSAHFDALCIIQIKNNTSLNSAHCAKSFELKNNVFAEIRKYEGKYTIQYFMHIISSFIVKYALYGHM